MTEAAAARAVLVTGAARRIGATIARTLAAAGWRVAVHYRSSAAEAEALARDIGGVALGADLADPAAVRDLVPRAAAAVGPLAGLVNNASSFPYDTPDTAGAGTYATALETNLAAPVFLLQSFAGAAAPRGGTAAVVNLLDAKLFALNPDFYSYTIAKAGLAAATRAAALFYRGRVRVNGVAPGIVLRSGRQTEESFRRAWTAPPLGRSTTAEEVAAAVRFFLETPGVNGQVLALDGGDGLAAHQRDVAFR